MSSICGSAKAKFAGGLVTVAATPFSVEPVNPAVKVNVVSFVIDLTLLLNSEIFF